MEGVQTVSGPPISSASGWDQVGHLVSLGALREPDRDAIQIAGGGSRTYRQLDERSTRLANALLARGLTAGDRLAAWSDTCPEYIEIYLAAAKAGLVVVPVNSMLTTYEAARILSDCQPRAIFYSTRLANSLARAADGVDLELAVEIDTGGAVSAGFEALVAAGNLAPLASPDPDDLFIIGYTSGTTGLPKGAMLTQRTVLAVSHIHTIAYRIPMFSIGCYTANMSFVATITGMIFPHFFVMGTIVLTGPVTGAEHMLDIIEQQGCTMAYVPTPWMRSFAAAAKTRPRSWQRLRSVVHAASKADPNDVRALAEVLGPRLVEAYGMTELSGSAVATTDWADFTGDTTAMDLFNTVGKPVVGCAVRVVDAEDNDLPHDGVTAGEIVVRSPALMSGYWRRPKESAAVLRDGWYYSGDIGAIDPAGYIYVFERRTDLIVSGGINVYPSEIENVIGRHPAVAAVAVVGIPHTKWGQSPVAVIVRHQGAVATAEEIIELCRAQLASYKKPTEVHFIDVLPRNASNKILRRKVRENLLATRALASPSEQR